MNLISQHTLKIVTLIIEFYLDFFNVLSHETIEILNKLKISLSNYVLVNKI